MRSRRILLALAAGFFSLQVSAAFDEGIDYQRLSRPQPTETEGKIEVLELFWYACPHCYHLEPPLEKWLKQQPESVAFRRMPAVLGKHWEPHARAYYALELMGVLDQVHEPLFYAIHVEKQRLYDEKALTEFLAAKGVDAEEFAKAYKSFYVEMKVRRAIEMGKRYDLDGVPAIVVNGKYLTSPSAAEGSERMFEILDYLIREELKQRVADELAKSVGGS